MFKHFRDLENRFFYKMSSIFLILNFLIFCKTVTFSIFFVHFELIQLMNTFSGFSVSVCGFQIFLKIWVFFGAFLKHVHIDVQCTYTGRLKLHNFVLNHVHNIDRGSVNWVQQTSCSKLYNIRKMWIVCVHILKKKSFFQCLLFLFSYFLFTF